MNKSALRFVVATLLAVLTFFVVSWSQKSRFEVAALVGLPSLVLMIVSRRQLGDAFAVMPQAKTLVTKGLYARIQHPMYVFLDLLVLAIIIAVGWSPLLAVFVLLVIMQAVQGRREQQVLAKAFGADYASYLKQMWF